MTRIALIALCFFLARSRLHSQPTSSSMLRQHHWTVRTAAARQSELSGYLRRRPADRGMAGGDLGAVGVL